MSLGRVLACLAMRAVPRHLRDSIEGDLRETQGGPREALDMAWHFQLEPYRVGHDRHSALLLLIAAAGVLWVLPMAAQAMLAQAAVFDDAFSRSALAIWRAPAVVAAVACGLLVGRASVLPPHADAVRLHLLLALTPSAAWASSGALQAVLSSLLLPAAAWLAYENRHAQPDPPEPA